MNKNPSFSYHFPVLSACVCVHGCASEYEWGRQGKAKIISWPKPVDALAVSLALPLLQTHYTVPDMEKDLETLIATIECEQPQPDLYK